MSASPDARLAEMPILTRVERERVLRTWNDSRVEFPGGSTIHDLFEAQVARTPDAEAIVWGTEALTYGELDRRANQLAHYLHSRDVGRGVLVGVCVPRSLEMVVSILAILKSGGSYVPLDPEYPRDRQAFMFRDSGATLVLTQAADADRLRDGGSGPRVLSLDEAAADIASESGRALQIGASADDLAYVIYTSGSTGHPNSPW